MENKKVQGQVEKVQCTVHAATNEDRNEIDKTRQQKTDQSHRKEKKKKKEKHLLKNGADEFSKRTGGKSIIFEQPWTATGHQRLSETDVDMRYVPLQSGVVMDGPSLKQHKNGPNAGNTATACKTKKKHNQRKMKTDAEATEVDEEEMIDLNLELCESFADPDLPILFVDGRESPKMDYADTYQEVRQGQGQQRPGTGSDKKKTKRKGKGYPEGGSSSHSARPWKQKDLTQEDKAQILVMVQELSKYRQEGEETPQLPDGSKQQKGKQKKLPQPQASRKPVDQVQHQKERRPSPRGGRESRSLQDHQGRRHDSPRGASHSPRGMREQQGGRPNEKGTSTPRGAQYVTGYPDGSLRDPSGSYTKLLQHTRPGSGGSERGKQIQGARPKSAKGPSSQSYVGNNQYQPEPFQQGYIPLDISSNTKSGQKKGPGRPHSGNHSPYREEMHHREVVQAGYYGDVGQGSQRGQVGGRSERPSSGQDRRRQKGNQQGQQSTKNQGQGYQTPGRVQNMKGQEQQNRRGQSQGQGQSDKKKKQDRRQRKPQISFEPYISPEELSAGLKRGVLIEGPIRINPRNFEEAYLPHPDGVSDIMISGLQDRNRALNGDIVAVSIYNMGQWKVNHDELTYMAKVAEDETPQEQGREAVLEGGDSVSNQSEDSDPDVIIESEEIIELDSGGGNSVLTDNVVIEESSSIKTEDSDSVLCSVHPKTDSDQHFRSDIRTLKQGNAGNDGSRDITSKKQTFSTEERLRTEGTELQVDGCAREITSIMGKLDVDGGNEEITSIVDKLNIDDEIIAHSPVSELENIDKGTLDNANCSGENGMARDEADSVVVKGGNEMISVDSSDSNNITPVLDENKFTTKEPNISDSIKESCTPVDVRKHSSESAKHSEKSSAQSRDSESGQRKKNKGQCGKTPIQNSPQKNSSKKNASQRKYAQVDEVLAEGSPIAKRLFEKSSGSPLSREAQRVVQRTAKVVAIIERKHSRACTGHIKPMPDNNPDRVLFSPMDSRVPRIIIPAKDCPQGFKERPDDFSQTLFIARITDWKEDSKFALGTLARSLGEAGEIEPETGGILIENAVDYSEFPAEALESLPTGTPWTIPAHELESRRDFRKQCVFTIDPKTARDLDDALSCIDLGDGQYEVGVHIADVSYFLQENSLLDKIAALRATSVYLIQKVIPMLPRVLCEQLCSLNPDEDRLTFSVVWVINEEGEIEDEWFGRSVIRSCVKLSYDHAQGFIEQPDKDWSADELPPISEGFTIEDIKSRVLTLNKIAVNLRKKRFDGGALRLDQVKLAFSLDTESGLPNGYSVYQQRDSNRLVEEFMLLANMAVAHKINQDFPDKAMLRRHPPPQSKMVDDLKDLCKSLGIYIDTESAGSFQRSLWRHAGDDEFSLARMQVLVSMCSKPMQNAKYFCTGCIDDEELYRHYALNVPLYTHFTSPIRRYPDVVVHRLLAAALGYCPAPEKSSRETQRQADHCNDKKIAAKRASDLSSELFFAVFVKTAGPFEERAMVMGVLDKAFDIFVLKLGVTKRVYCDKLPIKDKIFTKEGKLPILTLIWEADNSGPELSQQITIFTLVDCVLQAGELPLQWTAVIKKPSRL